MRRRCAGTCTRSVGIVERLAVDGDDAAIRPQQPGDHVDQRGLAGAGGAEQAGDAALARERRHRPRNSPSCFDTSTRSMISFRAAARGAPCEPFRGDQRRHRDTIDTTTSRSAARIAVRRLDQRIDRRGNGLGFAGNIGDEGDGGAEFADRLGKAEHHAGEHARQRQRQRDGERTPARALRPACSPPAPAAGRPLRSTAGSAAPAAETT